MIDCRKCKKYSKCIKPCDKVENYINQDFVGRIEPYIPDKFDVSRAKDYKEELNKRAKIVERIGKLTPEHRAILGAWKAGAPITQIAELHCLSTRRIQQIIKYYAEIVK